MCISVIIATGKDSTSVCTLSVSYCSYDKYCICFLVANIGMVYKCGDILSVMLLVLHICNAIGVTYRLSISSG